MIESYAHALAILMVYGRMIAVSVLAVGLIAYMCGAIYFQWLEKNTYKKHTRKKKIKWDDG